MQTVQFWFGYPSTYSYLSVARIDRLAAPRGVVVDWQPFSLLPIFAAQGRERGPFVPYPDKLAYMWRDLERRAKQFGLDYKRPSLYPPNTRTTTRVGLIATREGWCEAFTKAVFRLHWVDGIYIGTDENLDIAIRSCGHDPVRVVAEASTPSIEDMLSLQTERARSLKLFGAPSFVVGNELFWGDDRLEEAIAYAAAA
jgi:2-hydroxychromene-2-carboxylate isomerase